jgi:hypothetical protein
VSAHSYEVPGSYTATLEVSDKDGGIGRDSTLVTIHKRSSTLSVSAGSTLFGYATTLTAQLGDGVNAQTARLGGRTVTFLVGGHTLTAVTDAQGRATVSSPVMLLPGTYTVAVTFAEDSHYLGASAEAQLVVSNSTGKVTAGTLQTSGSGHGGFNVHSDGRSIKGQLQFQSDVVELHASEITAFSASPQGSSAWFAGISRTGERFVVYVEDHGEPGNQDRFQLWVSGQLHNGSGQLSGGNIQVHPG